MAFKKIISLVVAVTFISSSVTFAAPEAPKEATVDSSKPNDITTNPDGIVIPREFGMVKSKFTGSTHKLIIHIQDAHCNYEAQTNIAKILEALIKNYKLKFVSVEGADGMVDTSWFKAFPDEDVRKEVATYFMKKGEITGPEFLSITTDYPIKLFGAETRSYYIQNLNAFTSSYPLKDATEKYYNQIKSVLNRLKNNIYNAELKELDAKKEDYDAKKIQLNDYVAFLEGLAKKHRINTREYDNLFKLLSVLVYEKKIDFNIVDKERANLIDEISKKISKEALTELVSKSLSFKVGKVSSVEFYAYLKALAAANDIDLSKKYPNLFNYILYNSVYSRIENEKLFDDIKKLEIDIKEKTFVNDDQRTLERLSRHVDTLLGLINIKLMNGDYEYYKTHKEEFSDEVFTDFMRKKAVQFGYAYDIDEPADTVAKSVQKLEDFYAIAIKRDKAIVDNTLAAMGKEKEEIAVLVTGGFHSEGITKLLSKQDISYMVVCPTITKDVPTPYIQILTNQRTSFEDLLVGTAQAKESSLAPYLISAGARLTKTDLDKIDTQLSDRVGRVRVNWVDRSVAAWIVKAERFVHKKSLPRDRSILQEAYFMALDNAIANPQIDAPTRRNLEQQKDKIRELVKEAFDRHFDQMARATLTVAAAAASRKSSAGTDLANIGTPEEQRKREDEIIADTPGLKEVLGNIDTAHRYIANNENVRLAAVISGSAIDQQNLKARLTQTSPHLFNSNGSTLVLSLQEKIGEKEREGNFLGTLLAYRYIKEIAQEAKIKYRDYVTLIGMFFGRGERMSPYTQIEGDRKPSIASTAAKMIIDGEAVPVSAIEEALMYFAPVAKYLEKRGFKGVLDKWGDETEIASVDLSKIPEKGETLAGNDIIKIISVIKITEENAREKDWVVFDDKGNMVAQLSRNKKDVLIEQLKDLGIKPRQDGEYYAGVSLGPVAVSYDVLDIAEEIFSEDIEKNGVYFDFDPYLLMALAVRGDGAKWNAILTADSALQKLAGPGGMVPDFFNKVNRVRDEFKKRYGRDLNLKILDLGSEVYWADIGQHSAMREKYMALNNIGPKGIVARRIEGISGIRDENGNIIVNSTVSPDVEVRNSIIINSTVLGKGKIENSVVKDSDLQDVDITNAFAVLSTRLGRTVLGKNSGLYRSIGKGDLVLEEIVRADGKEDGMRHGTLLTSRGPIDMRVTERTDLRNKKDTYDVPIMGNEISFEEAYNEMFGVSMPELAARRKDALRQSASGMGFHGKEGTLVHKFVEQVQHRASTSGQEEVKRMLELIRARDRDRIMSEVSSMASSDTLTKKFTKNLIHEFNKSKPNSRARTEMIFYCNLLVRQGNEEVKRLANDEKKNLLTGKLGTTIDPDIYKRDSIRAIADIQLPDDVVRSAGAAYVITLASLRDKRPDQLVVGAGRESRESGERILDAFIEGERSMGATVIDTTLSGEELTSTPILYFASRYLEDGKLDGITNATASHLPKEWDGFKPTDGPINFTADQMQEWLENTHDIIDNGIPATAKRGGLKYESVMEPYWVLLGAALEGSAEWFKYVSNVQSGDMTLREAIDKIRPRVKGYLQHKPLSSQTIAADSGFGAGGPIIGPILEEMGAKMNDIGAEADYSKAWHDGNPNNPDNLTIRGGLVDEVNRISADLGISLDVDVDRLAVVSSSGKILRGDDISAIMVKYIIEDAKKKGVKNPVIVMNILCSDRLKKAIEHFGGVAVESAVGFNKVKEAMVEHDAVMGIEISSHIMFKENFNADDAFFAVIKLLGVLREKGQEDYVDKGLPVPVNLMDIMLSKINQELGIKDDYHTGEWRTPMVDNQSRIDVSREIGAHYEELARTQPNKYRIRNKIDGIKVEFLKNGAVAGWLAVRPSGTSPEIVVAINSLIGNDEFNMIKEDFFGEMVKYRAQILFDKLEPGVYKEQASAAARQSTAGEEFVAGPEKLTLQTYPWGGRQLPPLLHSDLPNIAEAWFPGNPIDMESLPLWAKGKNIFAKIMNQDEGQPQIAYVGFKDKIRGNKEKFLDLVKKERGQMVSLVELLGSMSLTKEQFEAYRAAYEKWVSEQTAADWELMDLPKLPEFMKKFDTRLLRSIASNRKEIVSYFNKVELKEGQVILAPTDIIHLIVGSFQVHPPSNTSESKNEAWYIYSPKDNNNFLYFEPQQMSNTTYSPLDFRSPIVWDEDMNVVKLRKDIRNGLNAILRGEAVPTTNREAIDIMARAIRFEPIDVNDLVIVNPAEGKAPSDVTSDTQLYEGAINTEVKSLIRGTYKVWPNDLFRLDSIKLKPEEGKEASIKIKGGEGKFTELLVVKGKVEMDGRDMPFGSSVLIEGETEHTITASEGAEVMRLSYNVLPAKARESASGELIAEETRIYERIKNALSERGVDLTLLDGMENEEIKNSILIEIAEFLKTFEFTNIAASTDKGLETALSEGVIITAYDTGLTGDSNAQAAAQLVGKFMEYGLGRDNVRVIRGTGEALLDSINEAKSALQSQGKRVLAVVSVAGTVTMSANTKDGALIGDKLKSIGKVVEVQKAAQDQYIPVAGLHNLALRIALADIIYKGNDTEAARWILDCLGPIAVNADNKADFTESDVLALLRSGLFNILPRITRVNPNELPQAYKAVSKVMQSL